MRSNKVRNITMLTMLLALGVVFHIVESYIPIPVPVPGVKLGFANIIGLLILYRYGGKAMLGVNLMRVLFASILNGLIFGIAFWLSLGGVIFSSIICIIMKKMDKFSIIGISVIGASMHCLGQIIVQIYLLKTWYVIYYLPIIWLLSIPTGIFVGFISYNVLKRLV